MTTYIAYTIKFLLRNKWWLIFCPLFVAICVYFYMGKIPRTYRCATTIYTGIVSGGGPETTETRPDWNVVNNAMDNLINIIQSQSTLHNVSLRLYARSMALGNDKEDTNFILAENYRAEWNHTPDVVRELIVRGDEEQTYKNLIGFENADHNNHVYGLFHYTHRYYSYMALSQIRVYRVSNSDMLEVNYENSDPGIVFNTLDILNDEFIRQYQDLRFGETSNVIKFFEAELARVGSELREQEDSLRDYSIEKQVINYEEQTKHIAALSRDFELQYEEYRLNYNSAEQVRQSIEAQMGGLQTFRNNTAFIQRLHAIGDLQSKLAAAEAFAPIEATKLSNTTDTPENVSQLRASLDHQTDSLRSLTAQISAQQYTKEGLATSSMIQQWLEAVLLSAKSKAQLDIMSDWKKSLDLRYEQYAPVGSTLKRKNRLISFTEQSYLSMLQALNTARLRQKNLQMTSATLRIINPPVLPISAEPNKRKMMVFSAFFATFVFILCIFILLELLDRTLRDKIRAERITEGRVIGAFPGKGRFGQRRFIEQYRASASRQIANSLLNYFTPEKHPNIINLISTNPEDGKSTLAEALATQFGESGMQVRIASWNNDFKTTDKNYLLAATPRQLVPDLANAVSYDHADVVIIELPPLSEHPIPAALLRQAAVNLVIAPANRTWKNTDQLAFEQVATLAEKTPTVICLNMATRDVVETFTGLLPPYSYLRKFSYQIGQFGFTAVK